ncbi:hypothetical protein AB3329_05155 [Streptococcus sp. H31]|uniref:hypothetical protein n=1 Tax=Streptococcus huangxiaojuni TaxID=3237239 RepID=UPI0034A16FE3
MKDKEEQLTQEHLERVKAIDEAVWRCEDMQQEASKRTETLANWLLEQCRDLPEAMPSHTIGALEDERDQLLRKIRQKEDELEEARTEETTAYNQAVEELQEQQKKERRQAEELSMLKRRLELSIAHVAFLGVESDKSKGRFRCESCRYEWEAELSTVTGRKSCQKCGISFEK